MEDRERELSLSECGLAVRFFSLPLFWVWLQRSEGIMMWAIRRGGSLPVCESFGSISGLAVARLVLSDACGLCWWCSWLWRRQCPASPRLLIRDFSLMSSVASSPLSLCLALYWLLPCLTISHLEESESLNPVQFFETTMDCSPPGPSVHGILQARIREWVAIPFSRGSSQAKDQTQVFHIAGRFLTI